MQDALYFVAIIPPREIAEEVRTFKNYAAKQYNSSRALRSPAHITLIPPFKWPLIEEEKLKAALTTFAAKMATFYLELKDFDCFAPRVIFVDIVSNPDLLRMQEQLTHIFQQELGVEQKGQYGFHPHMTIAFKDLDRAIFPEAWTYFSSLEFRRFFEVGEIYLLKHYQKVWEVQFKFNFH